LSFAAILGAKFSDNRLHRKIALEGHRFTPSEALEAGLLDYIVNGNTEAVLAKAEDLASSVSFMASGGVLGAIKVRIILLCLE
jgi:enoyl-CoA hydratase/carnithine racemase